MKPKTDMTPGVVGTALAAVAAGSLVLFSLVLQQSALDTSSTNGLKVLSPTDRAGQKIIVQAAPEENDSQGGEPTGETTVAETSDSEDASAPTTGTESFSPIPDDDGLVAAAEISFDGEFPSASGGTGNTVADGGIGATATARGPQATISKDPNGRPDDVTLPDRNGPKNPAPPHGPNPDRRNDDSDDRADRDEPQNDKQRSWSKDRPKNDRQKSWAKGHAKRDDRQKSWAKTKQAKNDKSRDESSRDKNKSRGDKPRNTGKSNNNDDGDDHGERHSNNGPDRENRESEDRNDRHDSRKDSDEDDDRDDDRDDDDDDRHDDSHHSNGDSRGHSGSRDSKH
jgi:hypothetical protein